MYKNDRKSVNINGSISGIVNIGSNSINMNRTEKSNTNPVKDTCTEKMKISNHNNFTNAEKDKFGNKIVKIVVEVLVGVLVSIIASIILYKLNIK